MDFCLDYCRVFISVKKIYKVLKSLKASIDKLIEVFMSKNETELDSLKVKVELYEKIIEYGKKDLEFEKKYGENWDAILIGTEEGLARANRFADLADLIVASKIRPDVIDLMLEQAELEVLENFTMTEYVTAWNEREFESYDDLDFAE